MEVGHYCEIKISLVQPATAIYVRSASQSTSVKIETKYSIVAVSKSQQANQSET